MKTGFVLATVLSVAAASAGAQQLEHWGEAGGWDVMVDPTLGDGCLIMAAFDNGSVVRIGFDRNEGMGYVAAFNYDWGEIEEGAIYDIEFALDGEGYTGTATGIYLDDVPGADIYFDNPDFLFAIAEKYTMTLYHDGGEVMAIDLEGTYVGLEAAIQCQEEMG
ncbi:MAG: hypothetical protein AB3N23_01380 [Paracoccaceae bacterium]